MTDFYFEVEVESDYPAFLEQAAWEAYNCVGIEQYSLSEAQIDQLIGTEAFCQGNLSEELIQQLDQAAVGPRRFYFEDAASAYDFASFARRPSRSVSVEKKDQQNWQDQAQQAFTPLNVGGSFVIIPSWQAASFSSSRPHPLIIHPGMGFGTGSHETTQLCLEWLEQLELPAVFDCLDFGAGSGILGLAAHRWGAAAVDFCDIDGQALANAEFNAQLNFGENLPAFRFFGPSSLQATLNESQKTYGLIFANILQDVLLAQKECLSACTAPGGQLVLSGLLAPQIPAIRKAYESQGFYWLGQRHKGDWASLAFKSAQ